MVAGVVRGLDVLLGGGVGADEDEVWRVQVVGVSPLSMRLLVVVILPPEHVSEPHCGGETRTAELIGSTLAGQSLGRVVSTVLQESPGNPDKIALPVYPDSCVFGESLMTFQRAVSDGCV
jgi:hypothetical protein